jgi:hypothetical protein
MLKQTIPLAFAFALIVPVAAHAALPEGCGNASVQFKVKTDKKQPAPGAAPADSAQLIFVQSLDGDFAGAPTTRFGIDGSWVGADKGQSYFVVNVTPGAHHICAARQSGISQERDNVGAAVIQVQAGKTYYFDFKVTRNEIGAANGHAAGQALGYSTPDMTAKPKDTMDTAEFTSLDNVQGMDRTQKFALSTSTPK